VQHLLELRADSRVHVARATEIIDAALLRKVLTQYLVSLRATCDDHDIVQRIERACALL
jgi:hypothetical protein